jgi:translation initiation factor 2B subunit (eIF-2B alpha/beta/delta family)
MSAIASAVTHVWSRAAPTDFESADAKAARVAMQRLRVEAEQFSNLWNNTVDLIVERTLPLIHDPVFTLSRSATVERVLLAAADSRSPELPLSVIVAKSAPGGEGVELGAMLRAAGVKATVVADSAVGVAMDDARMALLGADSVRQDGTLINKAGSYAAALVAADRGIPVYALCERLKIAPTSYPVILERAPASDTTSDGIASWLFDATPARLISAYITEDGPLTLDTIARMAEAADSALLTLKDSVDQARPRRREPRAWKDKRSHMPRRQSGNQNRSRLA